MIAVNSSYRVAMFADVLFAMDFAWWKSYLHGLHEFAGERWTTSGEAHARFGIQRVKAIPNPVAVRLKQGIYSGVNSGHNAVALAHLFGADRVVLLGYDMQSDPATGKVHHHDDHPYPLNNGGNFATWRQQFGAMVGELRAAGTRVVNASRQTALSCCDRVALDVALADPLEPAA